MTTTDDKQRELAELTSRVERLELDLAIDRAARPFQPQGFYTAYYATTGFLLGIFGAMSSLLLNIVGSVLVRQHPLELIRVYLTFPLGDRALELDSGLALAAGCCLYLGTGMVLGIPVYLALAKWTADSSIGKRFLVASIVSLLIWVIMYYGILSWLQPAVVKMSSENLIIHRVPIWVAALTHLVFGWTMVLVYPLGDFVAYRRPSEQT